VKEERLQDLRVETPLGTIIVRPSCNSEHPGVWIDLCRTKADDDMPLALIEFSNDDTDLPEGQPYLITRVWGNGRDESYTDRIVHQGIEEYFGIEEEIGADMTCAAKADSHLEESGNTPVSCKDCQYLTFSDCYGECRIGRRGIVRPDDHCGFGVRRTKES